MKRGKRIEFGHGSENFELAVTRPGKRNKLSAHPGSLEFIQSRWSLPPGPSSLVGLFDFPRRLVADLLGSDCASRGLSEDCLRRNLGVGLMVVSDHSGTGNGEASAQQVLRALPEGICPPSQPGFYSSTDKCPASQKCLLAGPCRHVFCDIREQVSPAGKEMLDKLRPVTTQSKQERISAYETLYKEIVNNLDSFLLDGRKTKCMRTGQAELAMAPCMPDAEPAFRSPTLLWISGTECDAFSTMGRQDRASHQSFEVFLVWLATIKKARPAVVIHEITELQPESIFEFFLGDTYSGTKQTPVVGVVVATEGRKLLSFLWRRRPTDRPTVVIIQADPSKSSQSCMKLCMQSHKSDLRSLSPHLGVLLVMGSGGSGCGGDCGGCRQLSVVVVLLQMVVVVVVVVVSGEWLRLL